MARRLGPGQLSLLVAGMAIAAGGLVAVSMGLPAPSATVQLDPGPTTTPAVTPGATNPEPSAMTAGATAAPTAPTVANLPPCPAETERFPAGYTAYHTYAGLCRALVDAAAAHPDITRLWSIGRSVQGREIFAMEISTHLSDGTHPPGVLFDGGTHGLEHLSVEMPLAIMAWLLGGYGSNATITRLVRTRAIFIVFDVNPDGAAYDISGGRFHEWRKNRQPNGNGTVGTDLNRNYDNHWGCCGLVSSSPGNAYYRGASAFSAPETMAMRDFVESLVFDGRQEIRTSISFHASGRLILWPYGYTRTAIPGDMTSGDHAILVALATHMAKLDGYQPEQASALYVDSGTARDWYFRAQGIYAFTFELGTGTYQRSGVIATETERNRSAMLYFIEMAGCPTQATSASAGSCT